MDKIAKTLTPEEKQVIKLMRASYDHNLEMLKPVAKELGIDLPTIKDYFPMQRDDSRFTRQADLLEGPKDSASNENQAVSWLADTFKNKGNKTEQGMLIERLP